MERAVAAWRQRLLGEGLDPEHVDELEDHLRESTARLRHAGVDGRQAFERAAESLGDSAGLRGELASGGPLAQPPIGRRIANLTADLVYDLRFAARRLLRRPGFGLLAVLLLAFGIGATTAIFSVVNAVLLEPLPFAEPGELVMLEGLPFTLQSGRPGAADFLDWRERVHSFTDFAAYHPFGGDANLTGDTGDPIRAQVGEVSVTFFDLLGVSPQLGRTFAAEEAQPGSNQVVILSDGLWRSHYGAYPGILGRVVLLDGHPYTVIGVGPPNFDLPAGTEIWTPLAFNGPWMITGARFFEIIARLRPEATLESAAADIAQLERWIDAEYAGRNIAERDYAVVPLRDVIVGSVRTTLWTLMGAVAIALLVIVANLTNLLLTQAKAREREFSVRAALGGSRARLVRQALIEAVLLAAVGGALGLVIAFWSTRLLAARAAALLPRAVEISPGLWLFGFALGLSLLTGALVGFLPALGVSRPDLNAVLKGGGAARGARWGARDLLVVAQVSLTLVLLVGAGLLVRSYLEARAIELGFEPDRALSFAVTLPSTSYTSERRSRFFDELADRITGIDGVEAVGVSNFLPLADSTAVGLFLNYGDSPSDENRRRSAATFFVVGGDYFEAMGMPLLRGRAFAPSDTAESPPVIVINEPLVSILGIEGNVVGEKVWIGNNDQPHEIIGIVAATHHFGVEGEAKPQAYAPHTQETWRLKYFIVRTRADPLSLAGAAREHVRALDPNLPVHDIATMEARLAEVLGRRRLTTSLLGSFGIVALLLSALGIHGTTSNWVVQRTREIGIRIALGAQVADVGRQFLGRGLVLVAAGMLVGLAGGMALTDFVASLLFGVQPIDPPTLIAACLALLVVAGLAIALPARRAARLDPVEALRAE